MKKVIFRSISLFILVTFVFAACKKEVLQNPPSKPGEQPKPIENNNPETIKVKLQAVVTIGSITYDSLPALFRITSWDSNDVQHQRDTMLAAGINVISVPKAHTRFEFSMKKWGLTDAISLNKQELQPDVVYTLGGSKAPKFLDKEESFLFVMDEYRPSSKFYYTYNEKGLSAVEFHSKKPESSELQFTHKNVYSYSGSNITRINVFDSNNTLTGFTDFTYNEQGTKVTNMHQKSYDVETYAAVDYSFISGAADITIDYLYNNGHALSYTMKISGGNKVEDQASGSTGGGEGGTYKYDFNINPFAHMNMPNMFLSNLSKNNVVDQQKSFRGSIPSAVVYKYEYIYDNDGYPIEVVKHYKGYLTGEHLYKVKTVYTYIEANSF